MLTKHIDAITPAWVYYDKQDTNTTPPRGVKLSLLTIGNIEVSGEWNCDKSYKAWKPLTKRCKETERRLGWIT